MRAIIRESEESLANLIYSALASLDGYVADNDGKWGWAEPDEEIHAFVNDLERPVGTYLYGRGMYEVMIAWETLDLAGEPPVIQDFAEIWRAADKIVFSRTLDRCPAPGRCSSGSSTSRPSAG